MKLRTAFGLGVVAIALTTLTPLPQTIGPTLTAWADQIRSYGADGRDGRNGRDGAAGQLGQPQNVRADGDPQQINAAGRDGSDGEAGERGDRPRCPAQPRNVRYDLQAPDGGDGGDGGNGGPGGAGGDVTLYYTELSQLRQILVNAAGGQPGRSGRGGRGAEGCRCYDRSWQVQICRDGNCHTERYYCRDGNVGQYGRDGRDGDVGQPGQVWLVNQTELLLPDQPTLTQPLEAFFRQPLPLSKNLWATRTGARALLASGSTIADTYYEYTGRVEAQAQVVWQAERSPTAFLSLSPTVTLADSGDLQLDFPDTVWVDGRTERTGTLTTYILSRIVRADEVTNLAWGNATGQGSDFAVTVIDLSRESQFIDTQFELVYRTTDDDPRDTRRVRYRDRFTGPLPANVVTQDNDRFVIALGQLPISDRDLQSGTFAQIELRVVRSLGTNSAEKVLEWSGQL